MLSSGDGRFGGGGIGYWEREGTVPPLSTTSARRNPPLPDNIS